MTSFDYMVIAVFVISVGLGFWRGLIYEVLSFFGWPVAFFASKLLAPVFAPMLPVINESSRNGLSYVLVFIAALMIWAMLVWLLTKLFKAIGLGLVDGFLGGVFGLMRGAFVTIALVSAAAMTSLPEQPFWRDALFSQSAEEFAMQTKFWLPENMAKHIQYKSRR
jgi:membrane protein required for colicin V production